VTPAWEDAVRRGHIEELQRLLAAGSDIDARDRHGQTALMRAARHGHCQMVEWLIERGAARNHTAKYGLSALMLAVIIGHIDVVRKLTDAGADLNLKGTGAPGFASRTALDLAVARGDLEIVEILTASLQGRHP
jgi:uncharacterized protein